jgi:hypothetical protein
MMPHPTRSSHDRGALRSTVGHPLRRTILSLAIATSLIAACQGGDAPPEAPPTADAAAGAPAVDPRDQYALAYEITAARASMEQLETALARTRSAWIGRRYRWELAFVPALCGKAGACVMMPFDHQRDPTRPIRQGWLPRLELTDGERQALADACQGYTRCVVEVSGHLGQLELSTELPTSLTLSQVEIHGTREARSGESWVLGTHRAIAGGRRAPAPRAGPPTGPPTGPLTG